MTQPPTNSKWSNTWPYMDNWQNYVWVRPHLSYFLMEKNMIFSVMRTHLIRLRLGSEVWLVLFEFFHRRFLRLFPSRSALPHITSIWTLCTLILWESPWMASVMSGLVTATNISLIDVNGNQGFLQIIFAMISTLKKWSPAAFGTGLTE